MPDSFGKRHRDEVKARKAAARDARRVARTKRRAAGPSGSSSEDPMVPFILEDEAQPPKPSPDAGGEERTRDGTTG
jgi:hypothetical protein